MRTWDDTSGYSQALLCRRYEMVHTSNEEKILGFGPVQHRIIELFGYAYSLAGDVQLLNTIWLTACRKIVLCLEGSLS